MPEISRFLGIVIAMYYNEHGAPHFHASYGDYDIKVYIETGVVEGKFPKRALRAVLDWNDEHMQELLNDWELARKGEALKPIEPLE